MRHLTGLSIILGLFVFSSCIKHEVIPAPTPEVNLPASFSGFLEGSSYEIIKDFNGYYCDATQAKELLPVPQPSKITYYSSIKSDQKMDFIQIGIGKLIFNTDNVIVPKLEAFTAFFNNNVNPTYKLGANSGVEIVFRDSQGGVWISDENSALPQDFTFTSLVQESDENGDYMKFSARFNVSLVDNVTNPTDTVTFQNAVFEGYFQR
ncbi:MAG TPA: hypothetical protein VKY37_02085 [Brumimicrobium sp.]|nr:hypothetical protein [Brumimicrobium sp.]